MSKKEETTTENLSLSKQRKQERAKERANNKREAAIWRIVGIVILALIVVAIGYGIGQKIYSSSKAITPSDDNSAELNDNGFIKDVKALDYVSLVDYKNITVPLSEVEYTDVQVDEDILSVANSHKVLSTDSPAEIAEGDTVSIEYVGTVDGVAFEGGTTSEPTDLEIGSNSYIDGFESQLCGHKVGDEVTVNVTFPENYGKEELNGKPAVFEVKIDGLYVLPEFNDDFVKENLSDYASTVEEYRQYLKDSNYETNLRTWVADYLTNNSTAKSYPKAYLKNLKATTKYYEQQTYEYMNQMYLSYYGYNVYQSFEDYVGKSEEEYDAGLDETCKQQALTDMVYQAIMESEGITPTEADYRAYTTAEYGSDKSCDTTIENQGLGYAMKLYIADKALDLVIENVTVQ